jgi:hypothetical protein
MRKRQDEAGGEAFVVLVFVFLAIQVDVIASQTTRHEQDEENASPAEGLGVPAALVRDGGTGRLHDGQ